MEQQNTQPQEEEKKRVRYVCEGECGAELTQEEWEQDSTKACGDEHCSRHNVPFAKKEK